MSRSRIMVPRLPAKALVYWLATAGGAWTGVKADPHLRQVSQKAEGCPRCDMVFSMLDTVSSGERVQHIEMVERGQSACRVVWIVTIQTTCRWFCTRVFPTTLTYSNRSTSSNGETPCSPATRKKQFVPAKYHCVCFFHEPSSK